MRKALAVLTFILMAASLYAAFVYAPTEPKMGHIQRIFYIHMGTVWVATVAFILVFVSSVMYLWKGTRKWDILAYCSAEIGVVFLTITILTGSIWAKPVWGTWWTWEPQLTTTFILWILYIVYLVLRSSAGSDAEKGQIRGGVRNNRLSRPPARLRFGEGDEGHLPRGVRPRRRRHSPSNDARAPY